MMECLQHKERRQLKLQLHFIKSVIIIAFEFILTRQVGAINEMVIDLNGRETHKEVQQLTGK